MVLPRLRPAAWHVQLCAGLAAIAVYGRLSSEVALQWAYLAIGLFGICSVVAGVRRHRPASPAPWWLLVAGIAAWNLGDVLYFWLERTSEAGAPFPSIADVSYYAFFPLVGLAHLLTLRRRLPGRDRAGLLDAALITVAAGVLSWIYLIAPYARDRELGLLVKLASVGYPLGDVLLLALLARLLLSPGRRAPAFQLLLLAFVVTLVADVVYGFQGLAGTYVAGSVVDQGWLLTYVLWGTAALHPSMDELTARAPLGSARQSRRRLAVMGFAVVTAPGLLLVHSLQGTVVDFPVLAAGCIVMFVLVLARLVGLLDDVERQRDELRLAYGELDQAQAERQVLLDRTVQVGEQERARLAADLHDGPIQRLAAVLLVLDRASLRLDRGDVTTAAELLERGHDELSCEVDALRRVMSDLRPPVLDEAGLAAGVGDLVAAFSRRSGVRGQADVQVEHPLAPALETALYRVVQEALNNVGKHAGASSVRVDLAQRGEAIELSVTDDGCGFLPTPAGVLLRTGHFGLAGMHERLQSAGGTLEVESVVGAGTSVVAVVPSQRVAREDRHELPAARA